MTMNLKKKLWNARRKAAKMIAPGTLQLGGYIDATLIRAKDGKVIDLGRHNAIVNEGKNYILDTMFNTGTQIVDANWYISLVDASGWTSWAVTNTIASKTWSEFTTYTPSTRPVWTAGAAATQQITNGTPVTFTMTGGGTVKGVFIIGGSDPDADTIGDVVQGTLWANAPFSGGDVPVSTSDQLKVTYTVTT